MGTKHLNDVSVSPDTKRVTTKRNYKKKENKNVSVQSSLSTSHSISKIDQAGMLIYVLGAKALSGNYITFKCYEMKCDSFALL